jgi:hypothetical protein
VPMLLNNTHRYSTQTVRQLKKGVTFRENFGLIDQYIFIVACMWSHFVKHLASTLTSYLKCTHIQTHLKV